MAVLCLAGCTAGRATIAPSTPDPSALDVFSVDAASVEPVSAEWWTNFDDPTLAMLVERTLANSPALTAATFSIEAAEADFRRIRLDRTPDASSQTGATISQPAGRDEDPQWDLDGSIAASWEVFNFGRIAALIESAEATVEAVREVRRDLAVTLASETALAYSDLRGAQQRLSVAEQNAAAQEEGLDLIETLRDNGRATQLDFDRAEAIYRTTLASIPTFAADIEDATNRLATLTGVPATQADTLFATIIEADAAIPVLKGPIAVGSPRDLLRRRPDVRLAEADLAGALALTQAARADMFPQLTLSATAIALFRPDANFLAQDGLGFGFNAGPSISWAGPDLRRVRAAIDASDARAQIAAANYEQTILTALEDAETALSRYINERSRRADLVAAADASQRALSLATLRFQEGLDDYLDVLDAQRTRLDAEDRLVVSELETARRAIQVYRSLGGIWDDATLMALSAE